MGQQGQGKECDGNSSFCPSLRGESQGMPARGMILFLTALIGNPPQEGEPHARATRERVTLKFITKLKQKDQQIASGPPYPINPRDVAGA